MDPVELLEEQHALVKKLFHDFEEADADREALFADIADNLAGHTTIEERLFYPAVYVGEMKERLEEAVEEHLSVKRLIADLLELDVDDEAFAAKMKVLQEQVEHHVEEEESALFPKVPDILDEERRAELGEAMRELFDEELEREPRRKVPGETAEAPDLR